MDFQKSTWMPPPGSHPTSGFGTRHGLLKFFRHKKRRIVQNDAAKTKISPVDIPTGRDPRANQSPTGALVASCGWPPFFESSLGQHKKQKRPAGTRQDVLFFMDLEGFEPLTSRMRTERSPNSLAFVHTLCTVRKEKSTYIRLYKMPCQPNGLS